MKRICIVLLAVLLVDACGQRNRKAAVAPAVEPAVENEFPDSLAAIARLLEQEDSIAVVENSAIAAQATITAEDLLALRPVHSLESDSDLIMRVLVAPDKGLALANRFMRMHYVSGGNADNELVWVEAVRKMFSDYCKKHRCTEKQAWEDFMEGIGFLECGTQPEINRYCYVMSSVEYYRTLAAYKAFLDSVKDAGLHALLMDEYRAWNALNNIRQAAFVYIRMAGEHYSSLPMTFEGNYAAQAIYRRDLLEAERGIITSGASYVQKHEVVTTSDWNEYLEQRLYYSPDSYEDEGEGESAYGQKIVRDLDRNMKEWLAARHAVTKYLSKSKATYYDRVTADYHWTVTNEAEVAPEGYD